jgi:hypothetical protein
VSRSSVGKSAKKPNWLASDTHVRIAKGKANLGSMLLEKMPKEQAVKDRLELDYSIANHILDLSDCRICM